LTKNRSAIVTAVVAAVLLVALNAGAAIEAKGIEDINAAIGVILLTNISLVVAIVFAAGTSLQRLKQLEVWRAEHEKWAADEVDGIRSEINNRYQSSERRLGEYKRADVIGVELQGINLRLEKIEQRLVERISSTQK